MIGKKPVCHRWEAVLILASPLGEEGHEVAKGCCRVSIENDTNVKTARRKAAYKFAAAAATTTLSGIGCCQT